VKPKIGPYPGNSIRLRLLEREDLPLTMAWRNKDRCRASFKTQAPISTEGHRLWFESYIAREDDFVFVIEALIPGVVPVGQISLYHVDPKSGGAELGRMMIGEDAFLRKGFGLKAVELVVGTVARALGLLELYLEVRQENRPAILLYKKAGFMEEGLVWDSAGKFVRMAVDIPTPA